MADMWYDKEAGAYFKKVPGTDRVIKVGGAEDLAMQKAHKDREEAFQKQHYYNRFKDYSDDHAKLFGADSNRDSELFYRGVGNNWRYALQDRAANRGSPFGQWNRNGFYEDTSASIDPRDRAMMSVRRVMLVHRVRLSPCQSPSWGWWRTSWSCPCPARAAPCSTARCCAAQAATGPRAAQKSSPGTAQI